MEFLSQSVAGKSQECMGAVEDGEVMSGSVRHRLHRALSGCLVHCVDCACVLVAIPHEELTPHNVTSVFDYHA